MPKMKTHRGAAKRFKRTGSGKLKFKHANLRHCLEQKQTSAKKRNGKTGYLTPADAKVIGRLLNN
jgi:large subunit ribosomal protein L35